MAGVVWPWRSAGGYRNAFLGVAECVESMAREDGRIDLHTTTYNLVSHLVLMLVTRQSRSWPPGEKLNVHLFLVVYK